MATTTNYSWTTPDDTALVKDGAAAIRSLGTSIDTTTKALNPSTTLGDIEYRSSSANTNTRLGIGTTGQVLSVSGGVPAWTTPTAGMSNPMTTTGDTIYSSSGSTPARLGIGSTGQVLTVSGGIPSWATPSAVTPIAVIASVFNSANFNLANSTDTLITMNSESIDTDTFHSTTTNTARLTIPTGKNGKYQISGKFTWSNNATGRRYIALYKNGSSITQFETTPATSTYPTIQFTWLDTAVATDYYEIYAFQSSGSSLLLFGGGDNMQFGINFIGA